MQFVVSNSLKQTNKRSNFNAWLLEKSRNGQKVPDKRIHSFDEQCVREFTSHNSSQLRPDSSIVLFEFYLTCHFVKTSSSFWIGAIYCFDWLCWIGGVGSCPKKFTRLFETKQPFFRERIYSLLILAHIPRLHSMTECTC